jgi:hypothetical protein
MAKEHHDEAAPTCGLTLDEVNDILFPLEAHSFGYSREGLRAAAVVTKLRRWRDLACAGRGRHDVAVGGTAAER